MVNFVIFGKRLKELRKERQMTQQELADIIGVTKVSISGYESGNRFPSIDRITDLAYYFEVTTDYLLGRDVEIENSKVKLCDEDVKFITNLKENQKLYKYLTTGIERKIKCLDKIFKGRY